MRPARTLAPVLDWARARLHEPIGVEDLAARAATSPRTFLRRFEATVGTTPLAWLQRERIGRARELLEGTALPLARVAEQCGYASPETFRAAFRRRVGVPPAALPRALRAVALTRPSTRGTVRAGRPAGGRPRGSSAVARLGGPHPLAPVRVRRHHRDRPAPPRSEMTAPDPPPPARCSTKGCARSSPAASASASARATDRHRPHTVRAIGGRRDGGRIVLFVPRRQGRRVLEDVAANGRVAVVFSQPSTHRTVQLKGRDARIVPLEPGDRALALAYRDALSADLQRIGYPPTLAVALLEGLDEGADGVAFTPDEGYDATPGPRAGAPLEGGA